MTAIESQPEIVGRFREQVRGRLTGGAAQSFEQAGRDATAIAAARAAGLDDTQIERSIAEALGIECLDTLNGRIASATFVQRVPIGYARRHRIIGLACDDAVMPVAVASLSSLEQLDVLSRWLHRPMKPLLANADHITRLINDAYQQQTGQADAMIDSLDRSTVLDELEQAATSGGGGGREDLLDSGGRAPVIKLVNLLLFEAVKAEASDVHVQPYEDKLVVRMRIDGVLADSFELPRAMLEEVVSRVKVMAKMNIAEKRLPQDGRATVSVGDRMIDLRVSTVPTSFGERIVIRLLDKSARLYTLPEIGMPSEVLHRFRELIGVEHGLVLVTGPTGSGKSTTLYAALQAIDSKQRNVITLEDPIEYQLPGVSQIQVNPRKGMTFASGLRSVLRQDPDIIMVGEIRDHETAVMAIQSALTGHLVFSTLHTNDAASAVTRLLDLGIEPYLAASSVVGVLAQRLVRINCVKCAQAVAVTPEELARLDIDASTLPGLAGAGVMRRGVGCEACRHTGFRGRRGIFELLTVDDQVRSLVQSRATAGQIKSAAIGGGMKTLRDHGVAMVLSGRTTIDEIVRVTMRATV